MREPITNPVTPALVAGVVIVIFLTIFAWAWAVRRPIPTDLAESGLAQSGSSQPTARPMVYAAIGASDVVGVGADDPEKESWTAILHSKMPSGTNYVRLGRGGITLTEANRLEVPQAIQAQPDLVTLWNSVNDATRGIPLEQYTKELKSALTRLTKETEAHIVVLNVPDLTVIMGPLLPSQRGLIQGGIKQWNMGMAQTVAAFGDRVTLVDLFPISNEVLKHPEYLSSDNFHPSSSGYARLADLVWQVISEKGLLQR